MEYKERGIYLMHINPELKGMTSDFHIRQYHRRGKVSLLNAKLYGALDCLLKI